MGLVYIRSKSVDPRFNLALEQYVFDELPRDNEYFMLWQNKNTIVVGKHQNTFNEVNMNFVRDNDVHVVRRLSGGGAVYHDLGNVNFTFIMDKKDSKNIDFSMFCNAMIEVLSEFGVKAELSGRNDMVIEGKKFSGNSQYIKESRVMHHGTLMLDSDLEKVMLALTPDANKVMSKGVDSIRSRVTNISDYLDKKIDVEEFIATIVKSIYKNRTYAEYHLNDRDLKKINEIMHQRYLNWDWNFGQSKDYQKKVKKYIENVGTIELSLNLFNGLIKDISINGDFFDYRDIKEVELLLTGKKYQIEAIRESLNDIKIEEYIKNLDNDQFIDLIFN